MEKIEKRSRSVEMNKYIGLLALLCLSRNFFVKWVLAILSFIPVIGEYKMTIYRLFFVIVAVIYCLTEKKRFIRLNDLLFLFVCVFFCIVSAFYPQNVEFLELGLPIFFRQVLPCYYVGACFRVNAEIELLGIKKKGYEWLYFLAVVGVVFDLLYYFYFLNSGRMETEYSGLSEDLVIPVCYLVFFALYNKNWFSGIIAAAGFVAMVSFGVRANMVAILVMLILTVFFSMKKGALKFIIISVCIVASILLCIYFEPVMLFLEMLFQKMGVGTRIFNTFRTVGLGHLSNREYYWRTALQKIREKPVTGYGIFGDRNFVMISGLEGIDKLNNYAHNLFLEIWADFGAFLGTVFLTLIISVLIKGFHATAEDGYSRGLYLTLFCSEFVVLLVSRSYLTDGPFFFLLGFSLRCYRDTVEDGISTQESQSPAVEVK